VHSDHHLGEKVVAIGKNRSEILSAVVQSLKEPPQTGALKFSANSVPLDGVHPLEFIARDEPIYPNFVDHGP
jgi:hypothetical protein